MEVRDSRREGVNQAVSDDIASLFRSKTHGQLLALKSNIVAKLQAGVLWLLA